jgi:hypothetical protein
MAASPRPLTEVPPVRRAAAPVVPLRPARRPSPAVIRRRRAVALGGLVAFVAVVAALVAGRGGPSDAERIGALLTRGSVSPATLCDHLSAGMLQAIGGRDGCLRASPARGPAGRVQDVRVAGDRATAIVASSAGDETVRLVRVGGRWKVDDVR